MIKISHPAKRAVILTALLLSALFLFTACGASAQKAAAGAILDRVIARDKNQMTEIMGREITELSDMEQFTMRRMTYKIISAEKVDDTHWNVTADTTGYDLMTLFNEAILYVYDSEDSAIASTVATWALEKLNAGTAQTGSFRAVIPLLCDEAGAWTLDAERVGDDLRDAVTGGAYSWYQAYEEVFGSSEENTLSGNGTGADDAGI